MAVSDLPENAYRARAARGEVQIGTWITMIRTPGVLTLLQAAGSRSPSTSRSRAGSWSGCTSSPACS